MLVLAAWVATEREEAAMLELLARAATDADVAVRRAAAMAAGVQATPALRALVEGMASRETDPRLSKQLRHQLASWSPAR